MASITGSWKKIAQDHDLQRSSHTLAVVDSSIYVTGGELKPREPRDNDVYVINAASQKANANGMFSVESISAGASSPSPRVGSAATTVNNNIYIFSGRGGTAMAPIEEHGSMWCFEPAKKAWTELICSAAAGSYPEARSYHCMASDGQETIYVHAGCPEKGRLSDLWAFSLSKKDWKQLESAPGPSRGGASIAYANGKLYRMNGFDGNTEQGGSLDVYYPRENSWTTITYSPDGKAGPGSRSVAALLPVRLNGSTALVTLFGESDPSSLGHRGAGKMLSDVWLYHVDKGHWAPVSVGTNDLPSARGWFDADVVAIEGADKIVVGGGLGESNERLDDVWVLSLA